MMYIISERQMMTAQPVTMPMAASGVPSIASATLVACLLPG
jgi:hypothetical protein